MGGSIVVSNIYNTLFITGISAAIFPIAASVKIRVSLALMLTMSAILLIMAKRNSRISRPEGTFLLVFYAGF